MHIYKGLKVDTLSEGSGLSSFLLCRLHYICLSSVHLSIKTVRCLDDALYVLMNDYGPIIILINYYLLIRFIFHFVP